MYPGTKISIHDLGIPEPTDKVKNKKKDILHEDETRCIFITTQEDIDRMDRMLNDIKKKEEDPNPYKDITSNKYLIDDTFEGIETE